MKIIPHSFNPSSDSGPNSFTSGLFDILKKKYNCEIVNNYSNADIEFCLIQEQCKKQKPRITRLDGIYFNTLQDYKLLNDPILRTYKDSDAVVFQSDFNRRLIEKWFGEHKFGRVIRNGANIDKISKIEKANLTDQFGNRDIWICASSWRPHKRLKENIKYFLNFADSESILIIAGSGITKEDFFGYEKYINNRIFYVGHLKWESLISVYKAASTFVHLAYLDHCPNVVVDAKASGCNIVCSSSGGTMEIAGNSSIVIQEDEWDLSPIQLYNPPELNFDNISGNTYKKCVNIETSIVSSAKRYYKIMEKIK
jgi:glycosyltransferase involved in cell wall biosynthesis